METRRTTTNRHMRRAHQWTSTFHDIADNCNVMSMIYEECWEGTAGNTTDNTTSSLYFPLLLFSSRERKKRSQRRHKEDTMGGSYWPGQNCDHGFLMAKVI